MNLGIIIILTILFIQMTTIVIHLAIIDEKCDVIMRELGVVRRTWIERIKEKIK